MTEILRERVITSFGLTPDQRDAAIERNRDIVVTAGAGSGKTRTLVARYASLLADGLSPRAVVAVTFTEKAAREMRSRVRQALTDLLKQASTEEERQRWITVNSEMDAARIGTIHSLCAEILRAHPAEAEIDPKFDVLDEGLTAALRMNMIDETITVLAGQPEYSILFQHFDIASLRGLLGFLLEHRLEAQETFEKSFDSVQVVNRAIRDGMQHETIYGCIQELRSFSQPSLLQDAGDKLTQQVQELLALWSDAENALAQNDPVACAGFLYKARREKMKGNIGSKTSRAKAIVAEVQAAYDECLNPIVGGKGANDSPPDRESENRFLSLYPIIKAVFGLLASAYQNALCQRRALDFDDLESGAARLLKIPEVRQHWQAEIASLLVDEFQDTNERQRQIVEALADAPGRLFVVGDARQSIYRFRRADVTVFRSIQQRVRTQGGLVIDLDQTYRAHEPLLQATGDLLTTVMGTADDTSRPYYVPFSPLHAVRKTEPEYISHPHIEFVLGAGEDTAAARPLASRALAARLLELKEQKQIRTWDDVTLLLRASTGFAAYENAFEDAGIPFVTVAGRGFYDRPEIRDVLNILRALADPADDLAMAGLLRSPAFGLTDAALYQLRWQEDAPIPYWTALQGDLEMLEDADRTRAARVRDILNQLLPQVDRITVADLLKKLVDITDYRSILAVEDGNGTGGRLWRNLDKLFTDAQSSGQINVRDFLEYLATINDAGAREGEAPAEAQGSVRLMTIHKSKGLEFPVVVLADASREPRGGSEAIYLSPQIGLSFKLDPPPMIYRLAKWENQKQDEAESLRLLYVALTRAKDKLIINGHSTPTSKGEWQAKAWLGDLCTAAQVDTDTLVQQSGTAMLLPLNSGQKVRACAVSAEAGGLAANEAVHPPSHEEADLAPLYPSLLEPEAAVIHEDEPEEMHAWRATGSAETIPPGVVGQMVHKAIELWLFPGDPQLLPLLETAALNAGLAHPTQRSTAVRHAVEYLERLRNHPLRSEIDAAAQRYHELPYSRRVDDHAETGYIDLLYDSPSGWQIVDFKTDSIRSVKERDDLIRQYSRQMRRYSGAVETLIGQKAQTRIIFLDDHGRIEIAKIG